MKLDGRPYTALSIRPLVSSLFSPFITLLNRTTPSPPMFQVAGSLAHPEHPKPRYPTGTC